MKLFKKVAISVLCIVALLVTCLATGCKPAETSKTIAVVAKGESHAFWQSVKAGAVAAGEKYGYKVTFQGPASESAKDLPSQKEMVSTALNNNPAAIVL